MVGHFKATREHIESSSKAPVLKFHDTTVFSWMRENYQDIGMLGTIHWNRDELINRGAVYGFGATRFKSLIQNRWALDCKNNFMFGCPISRA